ncbi:hypothetical protein Tco_0590461 [Tanacetum coccineum]
MWNISVWSKDHLDAYKWIEANEQWLYDNFDHCEVETSDDDDDSRSLWSSDDDEHFDPFKDYSTHPDARWRPLQDIKGLPAYSRIALLDTRFVEYQHACIGAIQTTLNAGTIFVTFYQNFNMPLNDPSLLTALKAQIQIGGTPQVNTFQATFHYQMAYRVQNHSLDILVPGQDNAGDALLIDVDSNATPACTYVTRQLS